MTQTSSTTETPKSTTDQRVPQKDDLRFLRRFAWVLFGMQLAGFGIWSAVLYDRYALNWDYHNIAGAMYLLAHASPTGAISVILAHYGAVVFWPIAELVRLPPHDLWLLWIQDLTTVGASVVAFLWGCEILTARTSLNCRPRRLLGVLALVLLIANPWVMQSVSFDYHPESIGVFFIVLAARDLERGRTKRSMLWILLTLTAGFVTASYVVGLALTVVIAGQRRQRTLGIAIFAFGLLGVFVSSGGSSLLAETYGYLANLPPTNHSLIAVLDGVFRNPIILLRTLWASGPDLLANLLPVGLIGLVWRWGCGVPVVVLLLNMLQNNPTLREPSFQNLPVYPFVALGTIVLLAWTWEQRKFWRPISAVAGGVICASALGWAAVWIPQIPSRWLRVSPGAAKLLAHVKAQIPVSDEVIASEGFIGRFANRVYSHALLSVTTAVPVQTPHVWVIVGPAVGIETMSERVQLGLIAEMAQMPGAKLEINKDGIWAFRWLPSPGTSSLKISTSNIPLAAWSLPSPAGTHLTVGPESEWAAVSTGQAGYVIAGDYWREGVGTYQATVRLATTGGAIVEAWNATAGVLLSRTTVPATYGWRTVTFYFRLASLYPTQGLFEGWGPFTVPAVQPAPGNRLELRVFAPATSEVRVSSVSIASAPPNLAAETAPSVSHTEFRTKNVSGRLA